MDLRFKSVPSLKVFGDDFHHELGEGVARKASRLDMGSLRQSRQLSMARLELERVQTTSRLEHEKLSKALEERERRIIVICFRMLELANPSNRFLRMTAASS